MTKSNITSDQSLFIGEQLRVAREAKNMTIAEVAKQLSLSKDKILNLEAQQWQKFHGRPYARGYLSNYVNFLELPHDEMMALFAIDYPLEKSAIKPLPQITDKNNKSGAWKISLWGMIFLLAVASFLYQYWLTSQASKKIDNLAETEANIAKPASLANSEAAVPANSDINAITDLAVLPQQGSPAIIDNELAGQDVGFTSERIINDTEIVAFAEAISIENNVDEATQQHTVETVAALPNALILQFADDCWLEITDNNNTRLHYKMATAGETITVTGALPLQVLLGNAAAVTAHYNDNEINIKANAQLNVARFSVGENTP